MTALDVHVSTPEVLEQHYLELAPQKDHLCGAFWGALALRCSGILRFDGQPVDQDLLAVECGTTLEEGDPYESLPLEAEPRTDYRLSIPVAADPRRSGTSAVSLRRAIERCSEGTLAPVPVRGPWTAERVIELFRAVERHAAGSLLIANWRTRHLWASRPEASTLLAYLAGRAVIAPPAEWDVGHFAVLQFVAVRGERGLVGVLDTYPTLGWNGHHLQPAGAIANALSREDEDAEGGILCVCRRSEQPRVSEELAQLGFDLGDWDNGSAGR